MKYIFSQSILIIVASLFLIGCGVGVNGDKERAETNQGATVNGTSSPQNGYNVYGGNTANSGAIFNFKDYTLLGQSIGTNTFNGTYNYYLIANDGEGSNPIYIDSIMGSNHEYYIAIATSNSSAQNLAGAPDNQYARIEEQGYILIDANGDNLTNITIYAK